MSSGFVSFLPVLLGVSALELGLGGAVGWWLGQGRRRQSPQPQRPATLTPAAIEPVASNNSEPAPLEADQARQLLAQMHALAAGVASNVDQHTVKVQAASDELSTLPPGAAPMPPAVMRAVTSMLEANARLKGELASASAKIQDQTQQIVARMAESRTDVLTGLANRRAFDDEIALRLKEWREQARPTSLAMLDVDHFKKFNDKHGHLAGDEVLRGVAGVLKRTVGSDGLACRYGGEEFAAILPAASPEQAREKAEAIRRAIEASCFAFQGTELRVNASLGVARPLPAEDATHWIKRADEALYASKKSGRNCVSEHDGQTSHRITPQAPPPAIDLPPATRPAGANDALTGLQNRLGLVDHLSHKLAEWRRSSVPVSLALVEVDHLEELRKLHGAATGDMILCAATQFLRAALRETDLVVRYADNTFGVVLAGSALAKGTQIAERVRSAIEKCDSLRDANGTHVQFTVSIGLTESQAGDTSDRMLERTAAALQAAIFGGRNCTQSKQMPIRPIAATAGSTA